MVQLEGMLRSSLSPLHFDRIDDQENDERDRIKVRIHRKSVHREHAGTIILRMRAVQLLASPVRTHTLRQLWPQCAADVIAVFVSTFCLKKR